jgi:outer membrane receptor protein involved in Fe transport
LIAGRYLLSPRIGAKQAMDFFRTNRAKFTETVTAPTGNYGVTEDIYAGYAQASYQFGDLTLLGGLRYEKTKVESDAIRNTGGVLTPVAIRAPTATGCPAPTCSGSRPRDWIIRAAWTNTIGRPDYNRWPPPKA